MATPQAKATQQATPQATPQAKARPQAMATPQAAIMSTITSPDILTMAALGRPFTLGILYDARTDKLVPGYTLWDTAAMQKHTTQSLSRSNTFDVTASDTIESRSSLLDIEASLKISLFAGMFEVGGSAKYLNDQKTSKNQSRVTCHYQSTTHFTQLSVTSLPLDSHQMKTIEMSLATHVVIAIQYGAKAFFVFDSEKVKQSNVQDIQGSMEAMIKKIPRFDVGGKFEMELTDEENALANTFSCKFYGDLQLKKNPATFEEAVRTYMDLPKLLGLKGENATPLKVWLLPLKRLNSKAAELISNISIGLVRRIEDFQQDTQQVTMRCNDSLADQVVQSFPQMGGALSHFQKLCNDHMASLRQAVAKEFPAIRGGTQNESSLLKVFKDQEQSPFSHNKLSKWLEDKERESTVIRHCVDIIGTDAKVVPNKSELDREIFSPGVTDALCFVFTSLKTSDPVLDEMTKYLDSPLLAKANQEPWYFSDEVIASMRLKAKEFSDIAKDLKSSSSMKFLLTALPNDKYKGSSIYHYKKGLLVTDDFSKPKVPPVKEITDKSALMWYACDLTLDQNTVNSSLVLSLDNRKVTCEGYHTYPDRPERFNIPQVLCSEALNGRCYWEAEFSDGVEDYIAVGVAYKQIPRKGGYYLGCNNVSWCFIVKASTPKIAAWHNNVKVWCRPVPSTGLQRVGVFLDWPAGTLSFYKVDGGSLTHLHTFTEDFSGPVYPGCYIYSRSGSVLFGPVE